MKNFKTVIFFLIWTAYVYVNIYNKNLPLLQVLISILIVVLLPLYAIKGQTQNLRWSDRQLYSFNRVISLMIFLAGIIIMAIEMKVNSKNDLLVGVFFVTKLLIAVECTCALIIIFLTPDKIRGL